MAEQNVQVGTCHGGVLPDRLISWQHLEEFRDRNLLREELEQRIRNVRVSDAHITSRDSGKRLGQGSIARP